MAARGDTVRTGSDPLFDSFEFPYLPGSRRRLGFSIAATVIAGLVSALLIGFALGDLVIAAIYGALILASAVVAYTWALGQARQARGGIDWSIVRSALDARTDALAVTDASGELICANAAYGTRCGGFPAPTELAAGNPEQRALLDTLAAQARRDGHAFADIDHMVDGRARRLRVSVRPADAARTHMLWTIRKSVADKLLDDAIRGVDGPMGGWLGSAGLLAALTDRDGQLLATNALFRQSVASERSGNLAQSLETSADGSRQLRLADGTLAAMRSIELPVSDPATGDVLGYLFAFQRIAADAPPAPAAAAVSESLPALLANLPLGLALCDRDGRLIYMNEAFTAAAGVHEQDDILYPSDLAVDDDKATVADAVQRASRPHAPRSLDLRVRLQGRGDEPVILTVARAQGLSQGSVLLSLKDDREQQKLERQIAQATKMQAVGQLAGGVAHDFNNILTAVIGYCDLMLARHAPGDPDFDDINQVRQNANRAANLVRQLLAFSRQQTLRPQLLNVSDVVGELSHLLKRLLGETVQLHVVHGRNLAAVRADPGQLEQVIVNLAVNARDAMASGGDLTITTFGLTSTEVKRLGHDMMPPGDYVGIAVEDNGCGIPPDVLPKIFEPFFTTKEVGRGTGLGLSTVYGIVKQTGGFIFAESEVGTGTRLTIYLPAQAAEVVEQRAAAQPAAESWGSGRILVVEDEAMVRAVAERALARKGYEVSTAMNGEEALERLRDESTPPFDLLISDVVMPTMDGPTLVGHARQLFPDLRIIFMSGYAEEQLRRSIDVPGVAFLPKPFSVQELADKVKRVLAEPPGA